MCRTFRRINVITSSDRRKGTYCVEPVTNSSYLHPKTVATSRGVVYVFTHTLDCIKIKLFHNDNPFRHSFHSFPYPNKNSAFSTKEKVKYCVKHADGLCLLALMWKPLTTIQKYEVLVGQWALESSVRSQRSIHAALMAQ